MWHDSDFERPAVGRTGRRRSWTRRGNGSPRTGTSAPPSGRSRPTRGSTGDGDAVLRQEKLFAAAAEFDLRLPDLSAARDEIGAALVQHFLDRWEGDETLMALLRAGVTNEAAAERMRQIFAVSSLP